MSPRKVPLTASFTPQEVQVMYDLLGHVAAAYSYGLALDQRVIDAAASKPELASVAAVFAQLRRRMRGDV
jgi:hypothetical protein